MTGEVTVDSTSVAEAGIAEMTLHVGMVLENPAEACEIEVEGENKWIALIQNASIRKRR